MFNLLGNKKNRKIQKILLDQGKKLSDRNIPIKLTEDQEVNSLIINIKDYPHAFILGCIADRQVKSSIAWRIPHFIFEFIGSFNFEDLVILPSGKIKSLVKKSGHRFWNDIGDNYYSALQYIKKEYSGDASIIWSNNPSSAEVVYRFLQFDGIGPKIASMAANILARDFKIKMSDYYSIDVSVDRHVSRVFQRTGLVPRGSSNDQVIFLARALNPEYPGIFDLPCFDIGIKYCHKRSPKCADCDLEKMCLKDI